LQQGELSMVCVGLSERDLLQWHDVTRKILGGHWGARQNFGGAVPPWHPPSSAPDCHSRLLQTTLTSSCGFQVGSCGIYCNSSSLMIDYMQVLAVSIAEYQPVATNVGIDIVYNLNNVTHGRVPFGNGTLKVPYTGK